MSAALTRLADAHLRVAAAERAHVEAVRAADAAREFASKVSVEVVEYAGRDTAVAAARAADVKAAIKRGKSPTFSARPAA